MQQNELDEPKQEVYAYVDEKIAQGYGFHDAAYGSDMYGTEEYPVHDIAWQHVLEIYKEDPEDFDLEACFEEGQEMQCIYGEGYNVSCGWII